MEYDPVKNPLTREQIDIQVDAYLKSFNLPKESIEEERAKIYKGFEERGYDMSPALTDEQIAEMEQESKGNWAGAAESDLGSVSMGVRVPFRPPGKPIETILERALGPTAMDVIRQMKGVHDESSRQWHEFLTTPLVGGGEEGAQRRADFPMTTLGAVAAPIATAFSPLSVGINTAYRESGTIETPEEYHELLRTAKIEQQRAKKAVEPSKISPIYHAMTRGGFGGLRGAPIQFDVDLLEEAVSDPNLSAKQREALMIEGASVMTEIFAMTRGPEFLSRLMTHTIDDVALKSLGPAADDLVKMKIPLTPEPIVKGTIPMLGEPIVRGTAPHIPLTPKPIVTSYAPATAKSAAMPQTVQAVDKSLFPNVKAYYVNKKLRAAAKVDSESIIRHTDAIFGDNIVAGMGPVPKGFQVRLTDNIYEMSRAVGKHITTTEPKLASFLAENADDIKKFASPRLPEGADRLSEGFNEFLVQWITGSRNPADIDVIRGAGRRVLAKFETFLAANPELGTKLNLVQEPCIRFVKQNSGGLLREHWASEEVVGTGEKARKHWKNFREKWTDNLASLENIQKSILKEAGKTLPPSKDPVLLLRHFRLADERKTILFAREGVRDITGKIVSPSLTEAFETAGKTPDLFMDYMVANRVVNIEGRGLLSGMNKAAAKDFVDLHRSEAFDKGLAKWNAWNSAKWDLLEAHGAVSHKARMIMEVLNPDWVPLMKHLDSKAMASLKTSGLSNLGGPIVKMRGGAEKVYPPLESLLKLTTEHMNLAHKAQIGRALGELGEMSEYASTFIKRVPWPKDAREITAQGIGRLLEDLGIQLRKAEDVPASVEELTKFLGNYDLGDIGKALKVSDMEDVVTYYQNKAFVNAGKNNTVSFWVNGERRAYELHPEVFQTLESLDPVFMTGWLKILETAATVEKLGATGLSPTFNLITNPPRDLFAVMMQTKHGTGATVPLRALAGLGRVTANAALKRLGFKGDKYVDLYEASGGPMSTLYGVDRTGLKRAVQQVVYRGIANDAKNIFVNPGDLLARLVDTTRGAMSFSEQMNRVPEFIRDYKWAEKKWGVGSQDALIYAERGAAEVSMDFKRGGTYAKIVNQISPFFNPQMLGVPRMIQMFKEHPVKAALRASTLTSIGLTLYALNRKHPEYNDISPQEKATFFHFWNGHNPDGSPDWLKLPKPFEYGPLFVSLPESVIDYYLNQEQIPDENGKLMTVGNTLKLKEEIIAQLGSLIPDPYNVPLIIPTLELGANIDIFREKYTYPPWLESRVPFAKDRKTAWTTETAVKTAEFLDYFGIDLPPVGIDQWIRSVTGGAGGDLLKAIEGKADKMTPSEVNFRAIQLIAQGYPPAKVMQFIESWEKEQNHPSQIPILGTLRNKSRPPLDMIQTHAYRIKLDEMPKLKSLKEQYALAPMEIELIKQKYRKEMAFTLKDEDKEAIANTMWDEIDDVNKRNSRLAKDILKIQFRINLSKDMLGFYNQRYSEEGGDAKSLFELEALEELGKTELSDEDEQKRQGDIGNLINKVVGEIYEKEKKK